MVYIIYIEKYIRTGGGAKDGLYMYQFCLNTCPFEYQPTGAMNMDKFTNVVFQFNTLQPPAESRYIKQYYYSL